MDENVYETILRYLMIGAVASICTVPFMLGQQIYDTSQKNKTRIDSTRVWLQELNKRNLQIKYRIDSLKQKESELILNR